MTLTNGDHVFDDFDSFIHLKIFNAEVFFLGLQARLPFPFFRAIAIAHFKEKLEVWIVIDPLLAVWDKLRDHLTPLRLAGLQVGNGKPGDIVIGSLFDIHEWMEKIAT